MSDPTQDLLLTALAQGLEQAFRLYYGIYRAEVVDNKDETGKGKILVHIHSLGQDAPSDQWVEPITPAGKNRGVFFPPDVGDWVWILFDKGNPSEPLAYLPMGYGDGEVPVEFTGTSDFVPARKGIVTRLGHQLLFSDEPGEESVRMVWHKPDPADEALTDPSVSADRTKGKFSLLELTKAGGFQLVLNSGKFLMTYDPPADGNKAQFLIMDGENGNSLTMNEAGILFVDAKGNNFGCQDGKFTVITEKGMGVTGQGVTCGSGGCSLGHPATMSAVCGEPLMAWLASHTHPHPMGPTSPPAAPPPGAVLSQSVKLKP